MEYSLTEKGASIVPIFRKGIFEFFSGYSPQTVKFMAQLVYIADFMGDDPQPVPSGAKGTVITVDSLGTLHCEFDCGRSSANPRPAPDIEKL